MLQQKLGFNLLRKFISLPKHIPNLTSSVRCLSCAPVVKPKVAYRVVVVGGGSGGCSTAARLCKTFPVKGQVAVIEPAPTHSYQPMWTLVGAGAADLSSTQAPMSTVLPPQCDWIQQKATKFLPEQNMVITENGDKVEYDYLVVAMGLQLNYGAIPGLVDALKHDPQVCSNYFPEYCIKTYPAMQALQEGNAIFTFPNTPIKCAGAPQKIMYLTEEYLRKSGKRDKVDVIYNTSLGVIFGVKKYAEALADVVKRRNIHVNHRMNLAEVRHDAREAVFQHLDSGEKTTFKYSMLHAVPPMSAPDLLRSSSLVDQSGFLDLNKHTLQHTQYQNVFGIGDCSNLPTAKTAAACAGQNQVLVENLLQVMKGEDMRNKYDGYTSCPLITGQNKCILAEFDYDAQPLETFPFNQGVERRSMYLMKKKFMPKIYWNMMLKGMWGGPKVVRKMAHLGFSK